MSAFPKSHFDRLEALQPVWAPYYVIHKIMAGLLDQHQLVGNSKALSMAIAMADYFCNRSQTVVESHGRDHWNKVLETEFGGMNDILYRLYKETGTKELQSCAELFDKPSWFSPLVNNTDVLAGLHANTHLAQVNGFVAKYESTGDENARRAVINFFNIITQNHSFSTGGSNWFERWGSPKSLATAIDNADAAANTQESCTTYNILKIARSLFMWTGKPEYADFYERALLNGVLGIQRISKSHSKMGQNHVTPGQFIYYMPLGHEGGKGDNPKAWTQGWGTPFDTFWCCYGTAVESFSKLADSIYFWQSEENSGALHLYVNQLTSSRLRWEDAGNVNLTITMNASLYQDTHVTNVGRARITINEGQQNPNKRLPPLYIHIRIPSWADATGLSVVARYSNGRDSLLRAERLKDPPAFGNGSTYAVLGPTWYSGDFIDIDLPMRVYVEDINDDRREDDGKNTGNGNRLKAVMMGPFLMAALTKDGERRIDVDPSFIKEALTPLPDDSSLWVSIGEIPSEIASPSEGRNEKSPLEATFRIVPPLSNCEYDSELKSTSRLISLENVMYPGTYLVVANRTFHHRHLSPTAIDRCSLELEAATFALLPSTGHVDGENIANAVSVSSSGPTIVVPLGPPAAKGYPKGARLLKGRKKSYVVAPIGQLMDEHYTAYLEFEHIPPSLVLADRAAVSGEGVAAM